MPTLTDEFELFLCSLTWNIATSMDGYGNPPKGLINSRGANAFHLSSLGAILVKLLPSDWLSSSSKREIMSFEGKELMRIGSNRKQQ